MASFGVISHRIQRNQNKLSEINYRLGNRANPFINTMTVLTDPKNERTLYLIGSTHSSTLLAQRTRDFIQQIKPDSLYVQTNQKWWQLAQNIQNVDNQGEMNKYVDLYRSSFEFQVENGVRNFRNSVFWVRFYIWLFQMNSILNLGEQFNMFIPGLEMKYAIEQAQLNNSNVIFGGLGLTKSDMQALKVDTKIDPLYTYLNYRKTHQQIRWSREMHDFSRLYEVLGGEGFSESFDRYRANWFVKYFEKIAPNQKRILVDQKDESIFKALYKDVPGKTIVAVVNQWHMEGIEKYWKYATGTQDKLSPINPIGDMDLESYHEEFVVNDFLRKFTSRLTKSEPATGRTHLTQYFKECQEQERTRHVVFDGHSDHHMYHGLPYEDGYRHHHDRLPKDQIPKTQEHNNHNHH